MSEISADDFDALYYPDGHGALWDLADDQQSILLIETMYGAGKPVADLCR